MHGFAVQLDRFLFMKAVGDTLQVRRKHCNFTAMPLNA